MPRPSLPNALYVTANDTPGVLRAGAFRSAPLAGADVAIQAAVDQLYSTGDGGTVFLASGIFNIANPIRLYQGIALVGAGMAATQVKLQTGSLCDCVQHFGTYSATGTASAGAATTLTDATKAWVTNAYAGKYVYIYTGTGAGQRRLVISNTATALTVSTGATDWSVAPDNTSRYRINAITDLFMRVSDMTIYGNQDYNAAVTGTATAGNALTLTDSAAEWTVNQWADRVTVEITGGTGAGQIRRVLSNTATALTVDGPWSTNPAADSTYSIGGSGIAMYGHASYDLMLTDVWTDECAQHGVYAEETWGHVYKNLISEYNGLDGLRTNLNPYHRGTTGAWPATTGVSPMEGPKMSLCKLVVNGRHGVYIGEYTYDTQIVGCELAGGDSAYGVYITGGATGNAITGNRFVSGHSSAAGAVYIGSTGNTVTSNTMRGGGYGVRIAGSSNIIDGNAINMTSGTAISDTDGRNVITANQSLTTVYRDRVRGKKSLVKGSGEFVTLNPQLGTAGHRAGCVIVPFANAADAQTEAAGVWTVAGYPVPTATAVQINCDTALTAATTSAEAVAAAGSATITLTSGAGMAVGGMLRFAAGGVGSVEEDVMITAISGADITATFAYVHDSGVAVTPLWSFYYDVGYNDRNTVAA